MKNEEFAKNPQLFIPRSSKGLVEIGFLRIIPPYKALTLTPFYSPC